MEFISDVLNHSTEYLHFISFGLLLLAGFNLPVSEDLVFIISASIAATSIPENKVYIFIGCFMGAYLSDIIAYSLGRFLGPKIFEIPFLNKMVPISKLERIKHYFEKYHTKTLFFGRFIPFGVRNVMFLTAGLTKLNFYRFMIVDFLALCCTSTILFTLGYSFGANYQVIIPYLNQYKFIIFGIFLIIILVFILKNRKNKAV